MSVEDDILGYYARGGERTRFDNLQGRMEFLRTQQLLSRYLPPPPATILDVGGGPGHYARWLASAGYAVTLIEPVPNHVDEAARLAREEGLAIRVHLGDARHLEATDASFDAVLELGPLYHLTEFADRVVALTEAARVVKPGRPILVAVISRFAPLLDSLRLGFIDQPGMLQAVEDDLRTGQHRNPGQHPAFFTTAYFHHPDEVALEFDRAGIPLEELIGVEGPAWLFRDLEDHLDDAESRKRLLRAAEIVERDPATIAFSAHLLAVGRSRGPKTIEFRHQPSR